MTTNIDFNKPVTTDLYTAWPTELQANQQALGMWLDSTYITYSNTPQFAKRYNSSSGLFEQYVGTSWGNLVTGYARLDGTTPFTGDISLGTARSTWTLGGYRAIELGAQGSGLYGGANDMNLFTNAHYVPASGWLLQNTGSATLYEAVSGQHIFSVSVGGSAGAAAGFLARGTIDASGIFTSGHFLSTLNGEAFRLAGSAGYIGFWDTPNTTRNGYIQCNAGANLTVAAENGGVVTMTAQGQVATVGSAGLGVGKTPAYLLDLLGSGNPTINLAGSGAYSTILQMGAGGGGSAQIKSSANMLFFTNGTNAATLDTSSNFSVAGLVSTVNGYQTTAYIVNSRNRIWSFGNSDGYGLSYFQGTSGLGGQDVLGIHFGTATSAASVIRFGANGAPNAGITVNGGQATTLTHAIGTTSGAVTIDCSLSNVHTLTLNANMTSLTLANMQDGQTVNLQVTQDGTGGRTTSASLTNANGFRWPGGVQGVLSTAANAVDLLVFTKVGSVVLSAIAKGFA